MAAGAVVWWHGFAVQSGGIGRFAGWKVMARLRRAGREAAGLEGVSPALRAWASDFGKTCSFQKSHQRSSPPLIRPTYVGCLRLTRLSDGTRRRAFGLRHPWLRPKPASNIPVLAPNRVEQCSPLPDLAHSPAPLARHPVSRPGQADSPQRIRGGTKTVPAITSGSGRRVPEAEHIAPPTNRL